MVVNFLLALFITFILVRLNAHLGHDMKNYGTRNENSKTITGLFRKKTGFDWHHIHIGLIILLITIPTIMLKGFGKFNVIFLGIGVSMIIDQWFPLIFKDKNYFHRDCFLISLFGHLLIAGITVLLYVNY